jgi:hypothetical protein
MDVKNIKKNKIMKRIFIVSPLSGTDREIEENIRFTQEICRKIIQQGDNPFASHLLYPQFLREHVDGERMLGINCGINFMELCDEVWVFTTLRGITKGMKLEIEAAHKLNKKITYI